MTDFTPVLLSLIAAAVLIAAWIGVRFFVTNKSLTGMREWVVVFVEAAEQALYDASGGDKLRWVLDKLKQRFPNLDDGLLRALVEAAVYRMKQERKFWE